MSRGELWPAGHQARRLAGGVTTTGTPGAHRTATLIVAISGQVRGRTVEADRHRRSLPEPLTPCQCRRTDRGTSMASKPVALLLADLGVTNSHHSRPHCS